LFELAKKSKIPIHAAACAMVFAERLTNKFITQDIMDELEVAVGKAVLDALIRS
jgi:archaellum component FlaD/FlaE